jgi:hypothetical protein
VGIEDIIIESTPAKDKEVITTSAPKNESWHTRLRAGISRWFRPSPSGRTTGLAASVADRMVRLQKQPSFQTLLSKALHEERHEAVFCLKLEEDFVTTKLAESKFRGYHLGYFLASTRDGHLVLAEQSATAQIIILE